MVLMSYQVLYLRLKPVDTHVCARRGRCGSPWVLQIVPGGQGGICVVLTALFLQFPCAFFKFTTVFEWACLKPVGTLDFPFFLFCAPHAPAHAPAPAPGPPNPLGGDAVPKPKKSSSRELLSQKIARTLIFGIEPPTTCTCCCIRIRWPFGQSWL